MKQLTRALLVMLAALALAVPVEAQNVTTGSLSGIVRDAQGGVLPGATVVAVHTPTGSTYESIASADGRFSIVNVRVGGPYELVITMPGFRTQTIGEISVALGESSDLPVTLQLETVTETVTVTAEASQVFTPSKAGTTESVTSEIIQNLPTVQRSLQDFARTSPHFVQTASNAGPSALSVAGRNNRYNNIQIDGAVNNDLFGIAETGAPGGQAEIEPISIDAVQEMQLVVSPYDVRQGGFSGGGVNLITKSGTNNLHGAVYYYFRDQGLVGDGANGIPIATFNNKSVGFNFGGPVQRNKVFAFGNVEFGRKDTPSGYSVSGSSGQAFGHQAEGQRFLDILQNRYNYRPGDLDEFVRKTNGDKVFVRGDVNLGSNQLTVRHNYIDGFNDIGTQSNTTYKFADNFYRFNSQVNSTVAQLNSAFASLVNEFRFTLQRVRENRATDTEFPQTRVDLPDGTAFLAGTEQFSTANQLDQDVIELTNDVTLIRGSHTFTIGTHNEFFKFRNLFIRDNFGTYRFTSLDNFAAGLAQQFDYSFSLTGDPQQAAEFSVYQLGFYAGDQWRISPIFTLSYGVRYDKPLFPDTPTANPAAAAIYGFGTDVVPGTQTISPRAGFNWNVGGNSSTRQQVRGGIGLFGGRTPYVWLSNQYGNTGIEFRRLSVALNSNNQIPFVADPHGQPTSVGSAATNEIDVVDPDYSFPQLVRGNLAYDRGLPGGLLGTVEVVFSKTVRDIDYDNLNLVQTATRQPDGRVVFSRLNPSFSDVILLTNTDEGRNYSIATKIEKPFRNGWTASGSYLYGSARTVNDGTSSQARSNWVNVYTAGDINNPPLAISNFDVRHRINFAASYTFDLRAVAITTSLFYNGQTGRPYSYEFGNDVNGDNSGSNLNDLLYYPREGEVTVTNGTYQDLVSFLEGGECTDMEPGQTVKRNTCRAPWTNGLDFHADVAVPLGRFRPKFTFDLLNMINLFDSKSGQIDYGTFNDISVANASFDASGNFAGYSLNSAARPGGVRFSRDDLRSRWQAQIGLRLDF